MQCQREGCDNDADYAVQIMSQRGYRVGLCRDCAIEELKGIGAVDNHLNLLDAVECHLIIEADWWRDHFFYDNIINYPFIDKEKYIKYLACYTKARQTVKGKKIR
jgi:hypothetical protein